MQITVTMLLIYLVHFSNSHCRPTFCLPPPTCSSSEQVSLVTRTTKQISQHACESIKRCSSIKLCHSVSQCYFLTRVPPLPIVRGLLTRVMVLVTPPTTVVTTWACWATVTAPDLCTVIMGLVVVVDEAVEPTWAAAVFSIRVAGLLTCTHSIMFTTGLCHTTKNSVTTYH